MIRFAAGLLLLVLAGVGAMVLGGRRPRLADRVFRIGAPLGALTALWPALAVLLPNGVEVGEGWFGIDPLSAWFLVLVLGVGPMIVLYGVPYLSPERHHRPVGRAHLLLAVLLVALAGVVTARTPIAFLTAWEVMAVAAWLLVIFESEKAEARRAGLIYLVMTHTSTIALFGMFAAWSGGGLERSFAALAETPLTPGRMGLVLLLGLVGFGIKAGMVPVHFWLPGAHAAAPSHISALLSGIMLKTGIYGLVRVLILSGAPPGWWGWTLLLLGLASSILGVLWALAQHDLKRLLAYHSVENIGIILLGVGLAALGMRYGSPGLVLLGLSGALLHSLNHALFKSLLFLGAGVVIRAAGLREIDRLGGLARAVPRTAALFLIGSMAIVGLPPLNGFVSEWLIFRGLLQAGTGEGSIRLAAALTAGLALTGALALACFAKLHGTVFLGTPRGPGPDPGATERGLVLPQVLLAAFCVLVGIAPAPALSAAARVAALGTGLANPAPAVTAVAATAGSISLLALGLIGVTVLVWTARGQRVARAPTRVMETWSCGYPRATSRMQYPASSFAASLLAAFGPLSGSRVVTMPGHLRVEAADPVLDRIGLPLWSRVQRAALSLRVLQMGRLYWYLLYVIFTLLVLLFYLRAAPAR